VPSYAEFARSGSAPPPWAGGSDLGLARPVDTDGDGTEDTVTDLTGGGVRITRASGSLEFGPVFYVNRVDASDFDGDGRTDLLVAVSEGPGAGQYVMPGSTPDGPVDPAAAGISIPATLHPQSIGDQTGDGTDDLAGATGPDGAGGLGIYSGVDLTAPGPGGAFTGAPVEVLPDRDLVGVVVVGSEAPLLATTSDADAGGSDLTIVLGRVGEAELRLSTGEDLVFEPFRNSGYQTGVRGYERDGTTWIVLAQSSRSGSAVVGWRLDALACGDDATAPATTTPSAPASPTAPITTATPAGPVAGAPDFTG
jgi:hypothetical protein